MLSFLQKPCVNSLRSLAVFLCPMAAELDIGRDSFTSSMDKWATTMKNRHQQQRAVTKQKHKADDQKLLKKVFSSLKAPNQQQQQQPTAKTTCVCAPTSHPGSFRCRLHRNEHAPSEERGEQNRASNRKRVFSGIGIQINQPRLSRFSISALEETASETVTVTAKEVSNPPAQLCVGSKCSLYGTNQLNSGC